MRFLYFYLMRDAPDRVRAAAPKHAAYWRQLHLNEAESGAAAQALAANDPFLRKDLLERHRVKEWLLD